MILVEAVLIDNGDGIWTVIEFFAKIGIKLFLGRLGNVSLLESKRELIFKRWLVSDVDWRLIVQSIWGSLQAGQKILWVLVVKSWFCQTWWSWHVGVPLK